MNAVFPPPDALYLPALGRANHTPPTARRGEVQRVRGLTGNLCLNFTRRVSLPGGNVSDIALMVSELKFFLLTFSFKKK